MKYIRLKDNGNHEVLPAKPNWFYDDGTAVSDEWLMENEKIYQLVEPREGDGYYFEMDMSNWLYGTSKVTKTYYSVIDEPPDIDGDITKRLVLNDSTMWDYNEELDEVKKTYIIETRTQSEIDDLVMIGRYTPNTNDPNVEYVEKPNNTWDYRDGFITKKYWILSKATITDYQKIFNIIVPKEQDDWARDDEFIYEVFDFEFRDINDIKFAIKDYVADYRWKIEVGGFMHTANGIVVHTDRGSQSKMSSLYTMIKSGVITEGVYWKDTDGFFTYLSVEQLEQTFLAVSAFVQALYVSEKDISQDVNARTTIDDLINDFNDIDNQFDVEGRVV